MAETPDMYGFLNAAWAPERVVAWRDGIPVSYAEFLVRVRAWRALMERSSGREFALYLEDTIEFASALFGSWQAGKIVYVPGDNLPGTCATLRQTVDGFLGEFASEWAPMTPVVKKVALDVDDFQRLDPDFTGLVLYTSGTTGPAQAIPKKLAQMSREVMTLEQQFGERLGTAEIVATVSHQHIYGLLFRVLWPLVGGRALHARAFPYFEELIPVLSTRECVLVSSPAHLQRLPEHPSWAQARPRLRAVFSSGGPLTFKVAQETERLLGSVPMEVYGSSETGGIAWRQQRAKSDAAWSPFPGVAWRVDPQDGVLEVRSPNLPNDDWFQMADRAEPSVPGQFMLKGRIDRIVKIEGKRISLTAIETALKKSPLVTDASAVMAEGVRQRIAAFVVPSEIGWHEFTGRGKLALNRSLRDLLRQFIEPVGLPRIWYYLKALPINAQGKTTFAELIASLEGKKRRPTAPNERLLEKGWNRAVLELIAPRNLLYFDGHFSSRPILPGVVQVSWVIAYGRQYFDLPPIFRGIHALKFQRVIFPDTPVKLELVHEPAKSCLFFKISSSSGPHASGRIFFGATDV
jgi:acyl-coenzyme A synthetase/AMP-(fatty) acid ligase